MPDIERALSRLALGRGGPRDLCALRDGLRSARRWRRAGCRAGGADATAGAARGDRRRAACADHRALIDALCRALADDPPLLARDGGFIRAGLSRRARRAAHVARRQPQDRRGAGGQATGPQSGVTSLKIRHNNMLGYHIEVTATHADKLDPAALATFIHRQTMASATRFTTAELAELETPDRRAADQALALELQIFDELVGEADGGVGGRSARPAAPWRRSTSSAALAELAASRQLRAARSWRRRAFTIVGRAPSGGRGGAGAPGRAAFVAQRLRSRRPARRPVAADRARTWPASPPSCARTR